MLTDRHSHAGLGLLRLGTAAAADVALLLLPVTSLPPSHLCSVSTTPISGCQAGTTWCGAGTRCSTYPCMVRGSSSATSRPVAPSTSWWAATSRAQHPTGTSAQVGRWFCVYGVASCTVVLVVEGSTLSSLHQHTKPQMLGAHIVHGTSRPRNTCQAARGRHLSQLDLTPA